MQFSLNEAIIDEILFYMENQDGNFMFDSVLEEVVSYDEFDDYELESFEQENDNTERFYELPQWSSRDGFNMMKDFANNLHNPPAKNQLIDILSSGRGVFRNFKNVLSNFPKVEKIWYVYKRNQMKKNIREWYNDLREIWHLERLTYDEETEENEEIIFADFSIRKLVSNDLDKNILQIIKEKMIEEYKIVLEDSLFAKACTELWLKQIAVDEDCEEIILIAETPSGEFAGMVQVNAVSQNLRNCGLIALIYVETEFRGIGLGSTLLEKAIEEAKNKKMQRLIVSNAILSDGFAQTLVRHKFYRSGSDYLLNLDLNG